MNYCFGDLFNVKHGIILVTTNSYLKSSGSLVMGAGAAKQLAERDRNVPSRFGEIIRRRAGHLGTYGMFYNGRQGAFQVKRHWKSEADPHLIRYSAKQLKHYAKSRPDNEFHLNYPGIGNGRLTVDEVEPILTEELGNLSNVFIWRTMDELVL